MNSKVLGLDKLLIPILNLNRRLKLPSDDIVQNDRKDENKTNKPNFYQISIPPNASTSSTDAISSYPTLQSVPTINEVSNKQLPKFIIPSFISLKTEDIPTHDQFYNDLSATTAHVIESIIISKLSKIYKNMNPNEPNSNYYRLQITEIFCCLKNSSKDAELSTYTETPLYKFEVLILKAEWLASKFFGNNAIKQTFMSHPDEGKKKLQDLSLDYYSSIINIEKAKAHNYFMQTTRPVLEKAFNEGKSIHEIYILLETLWS